MAVTGGIAPQPRTSPHGIEHCDPSRASSPCMISCGSWFAVRLKDNWSAEQIGGWLRYTYPDDEAYRVSYETIYRSLFVQARGVLKKELQAHLRSGRAIRRSSHATSKGDQRGSIVDAVSIRERPASVEDRAVPGHWEGDLLCGSSNSYIVTLVERHTRYVMLAKVANRDSRSVITALIDQAKRLPDELLSH